MARRYVPERGDVVWLQFNPQADSEQDGRRPALVISPKIYNQKVGLALFCPITSQVKGYPFEVVLPEDLKTSGTVLTDQIKSIDWRSRKARKILRAPSETVKDVLAKIQTLIGDK